jgi:hypothetical protein
VANIRIVEPMGYIAGGVFTGPSRLSTPDPKEAAVYVAGGTGTIGIDLGSVRQIDTIFVGFTNAASGTALRMTADDENGQVYNQTAQSAPTYAGDVAHFLFAPPAPISVRYINIGSPSPLPAGFSIGLVAIGLGFVPTWNQELGAGRAIEDTSGIERNFAGGFGVDHGAIVSGYQWTLGDLADAERKRLFGIAKRVGNSNPVLVVEDMAADDLGDGIHWGLLRLTKYERIATGVTKWDFSILDWV